MTRPFRSLAVASAATFTLLFGQGVGASNATATLATPIAGPALTIPAATLAANLSCPATLATSSKPPILLTPGTSESSQAAYSWGFQKTLSALGYPVCVSKDLPQGGAVDMQKTVEYVVYAIRYINDASGQKVSVIGHSQGGLLDGWALKWWPDLAPRVDDFIGVASPFNSTTMGDVVCGLDRCPDIVWQTRPGSSWLASFRRGALPAGPSYTSIGSNSDDLITPDASATDLPGATNIAVQSICPNRTVTHVGALGDNVFHALIVDAVTHAGPASAARIPALVCSSVLAPGIDSTAYNQMTGIIWTGIQELLAADWNAVEPRLRDYAVGLVGDTNLARGKATTTSSYITSGYSGAQAVDGSYNTYWRSRGFSSTEWISVDLGSSRTVNGVQLTWNYVYAKGYHVQTWNGSSWMTAATTTSGDGGSDFIPVNSVSTRYVRMLTTTPKPGYLSYELRELNVTGR